MDYTTSCSPWMVGVKTLIAESRTHSEAKLKEDELPDNSKNSEVELNTASDDSREERSVSSVVLEK